MRSARKPCDPSASPSRHETALQLAPFLALMMAIESPFCPLANRRSTSSDPAYPEQILGVLSRERPVGLGRDSEELGCVEAGRIDQERSVQQQFGITPVHEYPLAVRAQVGQPDPEQETEGEAQHYHSEPGHLARRRRVTRQECQQHAIPGNRGFACHLVESRHVRRARFAWSCWSCAAALGSVGALLAKAGNRVSTDWIDEVNCARTEFARSAIDALVTDE